MALRNRVYFFDPTNTDRFSSRDIPTEQTMIDWTDSVPFIKEPTDRSQLTRAGIAKTTTDAKVNAGDNTDIAGVSPIGFTTFVRPAQIPAMVNSVDVVWSKVPRGGSTITDTGAGIDDWQATVNFPVIPMPDTGDVVLDADKSVRILTGSFPCSVSDAEVTTPVGDPLDYYLDDLKSAINQANQLIISLSNEVCNLSGSKVDLGDVVLSVTNSGGWSDKWLEPAGQSLLRADYPALFALFGTTYGSASALHFNLPDMVSQQNYMRVKQNVGLLPNAQVNGGAASRTLGDNDMPDHSHTVTGTTSNEQHTHTFPIYDSSPGNGVVDGNDGSAGGAVNYTTPAGGDHTHSVTGTTNTYGQVTPDPVWDMNTAVTPRFTNFYLKMRVKP